MTDSNPDKQSSQKDINNELEAHFKIIQSCSVKTDDGEIILLAARPESRYPYFYPRDACLCVLAFSTSFYLRPFYC